MGFGSCVNFLIFFTFFIFYGWVFRGYVSRGGFVSASSPSTARARPFRFRFPVHPGRAAVIAAYLPHSIGLLHHSRHLVWGTGASMVRFRLSGGALSLGFCFSLFFNFSTHFFSSLSFYLGVFYSFESWGGYVLEGWTYFWGWGPFLRHFHFCE